MSGIVKVDNFVGEIVVGVGFFTFYAGMLSGMYLTITSLRSKDWKNVTLYALMTGGIMFGLSKLNQNRPWLPAGPLNQMELVGQEWEDEEESE